jgi:ribosome-associated protein
MAKKKAEKTTKPKAIKVKDETASLADIAIKGILEKKGKNITCLNLRNIPNRVCDYFIICEGDSTTQVDAIARSVEEEVRKAIDEKPYHAEGFENSEWILIDYVNVVVHVFQKEIREFYNLEALWADAEVEEFAYEY